MLWPVVSIIAVIERRLLYGAGFAVSPEGVSWKARLYPAPHQHTCIRVRKMMDEKISMVIDTMRMTTSDNEGVIIEPVGVDDGVLTIRYYEGTNAECAECVMPPDAFREMVRQMCKVQAPYIVDVRIIPAK
jgi:hypothetical protein